MAEQKTGMGGNPLARKTTRTSKARTTLGLASASAPADVSEQLTAVVADLAVNPDNPDSRSVPEEGMVASVGSNGVLLPLIVQSASVFVAGHPEHAEAVGAAPYVILDGHVRRAAVIESGTTEHPVPIVVRDDLDADEVIATTGIHRVALTPLQEADTFARLMERRGLSQRKLAEQLGVPQSQISKRLTLLRLPSSLRAELEAGKVYIEHMLDVVAVLGDDEAHTEMFDQMRPSKTGWHPQSLAREAVAAVTVARRAAEAAAVAESEGAVFIEDPRNKFKGKEYDHLITTKREIEKARKNGHLAVAPTLTDRDGPVRYYTLAATAKKKEPVSEHVLKEQADERGRKAAMKARRAFLVDLLAKKAPWGDSLAVLRIETTLDGLSLNAEVGKLCLALTQEAGFGPQIEKKDPYSDYYHWEGAVRDLSRSDDTRTRLASLITVAMAENKVSYKHGRWETHTHVVYLDWLISHGYTPTEWESEKLATAHKKLATVQGDSAESVEGEGV